jgi:hypothetical protein
VCSPCEDRWVQSLQRIVGDDEGFGGAVDARINALGGGGCRLACTMAQRRLSLGLYDGSKEAVDGSEEAVNGILLVLLATVDGL